LEAQSEQCDAPLWSVEKGVDHPLKMRIVAGQHAAEQGRRDIQLLGDIGDRTKVLRQTGSAEREPGAEIPWRDVQLSIFTEDAHDPLPVDIQLLTDRGYLIRECHLEGMEIITGVFHHR